MRPNSGILIIEVKDWNLEHYRINQRKKWEVTQDRGRSWNLIKSPLDQVKKYKENLFDLHISQLLEKQIKNSKTFAIVNCAVYFHNSNQLDIHEFFTKEFEDDKKYLKYLTYYNLIGRDSLNEISFEKIVRKAFYLHKPSSLFDEELYKSFRRYLQPPTHTVEEGIPLEYTKPQERLIISKNGSQQKIKGAAASGKTYVLAKRAINALKRILSEGYTKSPTVLILTYNITLKNYIHDRISDVRESFSWEKFCITNYHEFINSQLNNLGIEIEFPPDFDDWDSEHKDVFFNEKWGNVALFKKYKEKTEKFKIILIDEIQDYEKEWVKIIKECFSDSNSEFIALGDEKQNVYERKMENDQKPYTGIVGEWNKLDKSFRLSSEMADLSSSFQLQFLRTKYECENIDSAYQGELFNQSSVMEYYQFNHFNCNTISEKINDICNTHNIHPNDCCILGNQVYHLREIDQFFRLALGQKTTTMFETKEIYLKVLFDIYKESGGEIDNLVSVFKNQDPQDPQDPELRLINFYCNSIYLNYPKSSLWIDTFLEKNNIQIDSIETWSSKVQNIIKNLLERNDKRNRFNNYIEKVRKNKKFNFWMNSGKIKLSTIHSFKGWEINTLFLLLTPDFNSNEQHSNDELIYTALTRCRSRLFVLDFSNSKYSSFFKHLQNEV
jgi:superfamily I DNA/RNA helicase